MKHLDFSFLTCRMEPLLKHCSHLTSNRTECPGGVAMISEYLSPPREGDFSRGHLSVRARVGVGFGLTGSLGPLHALTSFMGSMVVILSACHPSSPLTLRKTIISGFSSPRFQRELV